MKLAEQNARPQVLEQWDWHVEHIHLPPREDLNESRLLTRLAGSESEKQKSKAAVMLAYLRRWKEVPILVTCLSLNEDVAILHLPAEAFIEYQLFARDLRPEAFVAVAAYGDLGPVYITLERSFEEGGYEPTDAYVSGRSEAIMKSAIEKVFKSG